MTNEDKKSGFTLIELMVAMGIIAVLATMSIFGIQTVQRSLRNTQRRDVISSLKLYVESYNTNFGTYPLNSDVVYNGTAGEIQVVDGSTVVDQIPVAGATRPVNNANPGGTGAAFCYNSTTGTTYTMGVKIEGGNWEQFGNDLTSPDCETPTIY